MSIWDDIKQKVEDIVNVHSNTNKFDNLDYTNKWVKYDHLMYRMTHCKACTDSDGKIYASDDDNKPELPRHPRCDCKYTKLKQIIAGFATNLGIEGADYYLKHFGKLPDYYISKEQAEKLGWRSKKGNLTEVAPGKMIGGNIYKNRPPLLPEKDRRIWYECDINYTSGFRNNQRLVYSNDGLIFLTDSHYKDFIWIE